MTAGAPEGAARPRWVALARAEARYLWRALRDGGVVSGGGVFVLALLFVLKVLLVDGVEPGARGLFFLVGVGYAVYVASIAGLVGALGTLLFRTVRAYALVPIVLIPATLWLSVRVFEGFLDAQLGDVFTALGVAARERPWLIAQIGPAARVGPVILIMAFPLLMIDLGALLLDPGVLWQLAILSLDVFFVVAIGTVPAAAVSLVALGVAYARGFRRRHGSPLAS